MSIDAKLDIVFILAVVVYIAYSWIAIGRLVKDIRAMNRIIKRLQAENGMRADGIDKVGK